MDFSFSCQWHCVILKIEKINDIDFETKSIKLNSERKEM